MNRFDEGGAGTNHWSNIEVQWDMAPLVPGSADPNVNVDKVYLGTNIAGQLAIAYDSWVEVSADIDLTNNSLEVFYGGASLGATTWAKGTNPVNGIDVL